MANRTSEILKGNKFSPNIDDYSVFIESMKKPKIEFSGLTVLDKKEFDKMDIKEYGFWLKNSSLEFDGFAEEFKLIEQQISKHYKIAKELLTSQLDYEAIAKKNQSLKELIRELELALIPLRKLSLIIDPLITSSSTVHPRSKIKYAVIKAYWIDSEGNLKRSVNRNVGVNEWGMEDVATKMFSAFGFSTYVPANRMENGAMVDMVISKNGKSWVVEIKQQKKDDFEKAFVSLELWRLYKAEYKDEFELE
ncbi:hypothetical protein [Aquirufa aurantiipilula]|uniref:Uncharacterized protein n=1 Tax=Aquirufa aurantiipilula TaxID=2696561 RepID=A0ABT6BMA5_9BACT|nr:hypothetical protein [Aquirufa aurantiipilula]MDF5691611.1 hypothetical protein [Aquirufa aurantiipilula]